MATTESVFKGKESESALHFLKCLLSAQLLNFRLLVSLFLTKFRMYVYIHDNYSVTQILPLEFETYRFNVG